MELNACKILARRLPAYGAHIVATVYDQVLVEVAEERAAEVEAVVVTAMKEGMQRYVKSVPIEVEARVIRTWGG